MQLKRYLPKLAANLTQLPKGEALTVICSSGYRSSIAANLLLAWQAADLVFNPMI